MGGERFSAASLEHPIVLAPLGGGPATPELAAAVSEAGGLGFLAAGYKTPDAVRADLARARELTSRPLGVNVFVPSPPAPDASRAAEYGRALRAEAERLGVEPGEPRHDDDAWDAKVALLAEERPEVVSFTFGCPPAEAVAELQRAGTAAWATVTTPDEALEARDAGVDALVVQGAEAGGHRASFDDETTTDLGILSALALVAEAVDLPLIATGGLATGRSVAAVLAAGAVAAQLGSAFMLADEAGTARGHREALSSPGDTRLTRAFTGRTARGIVNRFMREHEGDAPHAYPEVHHVTAPLRSAARERGDTDGFHLWAGPAHALARTGPAAEIVRALAAEAREALRDAAGRAGS